MGLTEVEAITRARAVAEQRGWPFREEIRAASFRAWWVGPRRWRVETNWGNLGSNVRVEIDDATGDILKASYLPR